MGVAMFLSKARADFKYQRTQRLGQFLMNRLHTEHPQLHEKIQNTDVDPFYDDTRIPAFQSFLWNHW